VAEVTDFDDISISGAILGAALAASLVGIALVIIAVCLQ
jgi:hypothetical protein